MKIVDIHLHGIGGFETRTKSPDDILRLAEIEESHGVSAIVPTIYPAAVSEMRSNIEAVKKAMDLQSRNSRGAEILGVNLEGPFLNPLFAGALDAGIFLSPSERSYREITEGFEEIIRIITISPELEGALPLVRFLADRGVAVSLGHTNATFTEAEAAHGQGARGITHLFNAMRPYHHREPGIAGFGLLNRDMYVELICDPFHLHPATLDMVFRMKDPSRIIIVSDSVKDTPAVFGASASRLRTAEGVLQGGAMTVAEAAERLVGTGFDRGRVMECISTNPAQYLAGR